MWIRGRVLHIVLLISGAACISNPPPLTSPEPTSLHTAKSVDDVAQIASRELASAGFELTIAGAAVVQGKRNGTPPTQGDMITCRFGRQSMAWQAGQVRMTVSIATSTRSASNGSDVTISTRVLMDYTKLPGMYSMAGMKEGDCVSSGVIEKRIATAVQ